MGVLDKDVQSARGCLRAVLLITLVTLAGVVLAAWGAYTSVERACLREAAAWLPPYPGATLVEERATQRLFGIGTTSQRWSTPDDPNTVRAYYYDVWQANAEAGLSIAGTRARLDRREFRQPDGGTQIVFTASCVPQMDFSQVRWVTTAEPPAPAVAPPA